MSDNIEFPESSKASKYSRTALNAASGLIPFAGGVFSAISGAWSEKEQDQVNIFFKHWVQGIEDELKEKEITLLEIMSRLDLHDESMSKRVESKEYQSLIRRTFRDWAATESEKKREYVRNILSNAASSSLASDDVVRLFMTWIDTYSEMHFEVISATYNANGISRGEIWRKIGKESAREDSAEADVYKLLIRDLSTGGIIRQHREVDYYGNFVPKPKKKTVKGASRTIKSAFDEDELYVLTELGQQFIHYAMTELPVRIEFKDEKSASE
ncbi:hypothetical protein [Vibrio sp. MA40-2]|uniref:hypothetical protein n=1 Tax=Vibrio sp. MA40-2 TaxID=3391828 RepID=UPI0039A7530D